MKNNKLFAVRVYALGPVFNNKFLGYISPHTKIELYRREYGYSTISDVFSKEKIRFYKRKSDASQSADILLKKAERVKVAESFGLTIQGSNFPHFTYSLEEFDITPSRDRIVEEVKSMLLSFMDEINEVFEQRLLNFTVRVHDEINKNFNAN